MRTISTLFCIAATITLFACNKSSPPPEKPVTPRTLLHIEIPVQLPVP